MTERPLLDRALETELAYFRLGAEVEHRPGLLICWTSAFIRAPAASVVLIADPQAAAATGSWLSQLETRLGGLGARLARIYLPTRHAGIEACLGEAGYVPRRELIFVGRLADPPAAIALRLVRTEQDWTRKLRLLEAAGESPDGHSNRISDLVALERHKCAHGMQAFLAEIDGAAVGAVCTLWGDGVVRIKNLVVHPAHRRKSIGTSLLKCVAALGRSRGIVDQCLLAIEGGDGERLYRSAGMTVAGFQTEWSRPLAGEGRST